MAGSHGYILSVHELDLTPLDERRLELPIRIGRSSLNDVPVAHRLVSEFHARIEEVDGKLCVRDLSSKNGVLVEALGSPGPERVAPQRLVELEPYGYEFLLSPLLRVRVRPAGEASESRRGASSVARGGMAVAPPPQLPLASPAVLAGGPPPSASAAVLAYASVFIEPSAEALELPPVRSAPALPAVRAEPVLAARVSPAPARAATLREAPAPRALTAPELPAARPGAAPATAWELASNGTVPVAAAPSRPGSGVASADPLAALPGLSLEALALRGLRELGTSLLPGQPLETPSDVIQLISKLHDALQMFCRCFIPVREACSRFIPPDELDRAARERCLHRSGAYMAAERALEPRALLRALIDWRDNAEDAPRAVEHILADLMLQNLALTEGALDGTRALLDELAPTRIESEQSTTQGVLSRLAGGRERALWEAFEARHAELAAAGDLFRELFGEAFARAYEARAGAAQRS